MQWGGQCVITNILYIVFGVNGKESIGTSIGTFIIIMMLYAINICFPKSKIIVMLLARFS